jgi:hypothetical protein
MYEKATGVRGDAAAMWTMDGCGGRILLSSLPLFGIAS